MQKLVFSKKEDFFRHNKHLRKIVSDMSENNADKKPTRRIVI